MGAMASVGRGGDQASFVAVMRWNGGTGAPVALIGKRVTFDSGGISIKAADGLQEMKADMGGAAAIVGAMHAIAARRARQCRGHCGPRREHAFGQCLSPRRHRPIDVGARDRNHQYRR